jgi:putative ABC transport system permease protein
MFIVSIALRLNIPTEAFKLVSALIVAIALIAPQAKKMVAFELHKRSAVRSASGSRGGER